MKQCIWIDITLSINFSTFFVVFFPQCLMHLEDKLKEIYLKSLVGALLFVVLFCCYCLLGIVFTLIPFPAQVRFLLRAGNRLFLPAIDVNVTAYLEKNTIEMMLRTSTLAFRSSHLRLYIYSLF